MMDLIAHFESQGLTEDEAKVEAFNTAMKGA
jgi:glutamate synthase (ferredoxin)